MKTGRTAAFARSWARGVAGLNFLMVLGGLIGVIASRYEVEAGVWVILAALVTGAIAYSLIAVLILARHPRHVLGWLFLLIGFIEALAVFDGLFYALAQTLPIRSEPLRGLIVLVLELSLAIELVLPVSVVLLYFPDGRLPSRRWWPVAAAILVGVGGLVVITTFSPFSAELQAELDAANPLAIAPRAWFQSLGGFFNTLATIGTMGALASLVVRFRRATGIERTQMKWLVYTAVSGILFLAAFGQLINDSPVSGVLFFWPNLLAIAIGIAILRHQLWDIDLIIRRTLQYALLTALLALVYFGAVVLLQNLFGSLTGDENSPLITVLSTLAIAALFNPLRTRIQDFIDRRFYRQKYDAEQVLALFATAARDEVDLGALAAAMLGAVDETLQPQGASLWLKPAPGLSRQRREGKS